MSRCEDCVISRIGDLSMAMVAVTATIKRRKLRGWAWHIHSAWRSDYFLNGESVTKDEAHEIIQTIGRIASVAWERGYQFGRSDMTDDPDHERNDGENDQDRPQHVIRPGSESPCRESPGR